MSSTFAGTAPLDLIASVYGGRLNRICVNDSSCSKEPALASASWLSVAYAGSGCETRRLTAFCDSVFAVLITVLVLDLRPPEFPTLCLFGGAAVVALKYPLLGLAIAVA
jgi:hypothetical protein